MESCVTHYNAFAEDMNKVRKDNKVVNDYLSHLPDTAGFLQIDDLEKLLKNEQGKIQARLRQLSDFVTTVKQECVMNQHFFSFFEIPEVIVKKNYARKDYEEIILKYLQKVQAAYLAEKAVENPDLPKEQLFITDEDLVKLDYLDQIYDQIKHKYDEKELTIKKLLDDCHKSVKEMQVKAAKPSEKIQKIIEQN